MRSTSHKGTTMVEYTVIAVVVLLSTAGGWALLGNNLGTMFGQERDDMKKSITSSKNQEAVDQAAAAAAAAAAAIAKLPPAPGSGGKAGGGTAVVGAINTADVSSLIQTAGANGATESLASSMEALGAKLLADGKITQAQADLITQLANQGHDLAGGEAALQAAVNSGSPTVTYNGVTMATADFQASLGFNNSVGINAASTMDAASALAALQPFMTTYNELVSSGALTDPTASATITNLSKQIASLSDLAKWNTTTDAADLTSAYVTAMAQVGVVDPPATIADATNANSTTICAVGSGTDSGTSCSN